MARPVHAARNQDLGGHPEVDSAVRDGPVVSSQPETRMYHREHPQTWFCSAQSCREENSEAFAVQHAVSSTSFYLFDEASAIPDKIFEVAEGGLTDGEPMICASLSGNPTRANGKFSSRHVRIGPRALESPVDRLPNLHAAQQSPDRRIDRGLRRG